MNSFISRRRLLMGLVLFPAEPESYLEIVRYTSSGSFFAPEDGFFEIELHGASGCGGEAKTSGEEGIPGGGGGGGGGGGFSASRVKMRKGDKIFCDSGAVGNSSTAKIESSIDRSHNITVYPAENGKEPPHIWDDPKDIELEGGNGGAGGKAEGGNFRNLEGLSGGKGSSDPKAKEAPAAGTKGISQAIGGRNGGLGGTIFDSGSWGLHSRDGEKGENGFIKIYAGNKN